MNEQFDELAKGLAQSVTRRGALEKFGVGLVGIVLASLGLANKAEASGRKCHSDADCHSNEYCDFNPFEVHGYCLHRKKGGP